VVWEIRRSGYERKLIGGIVLTGGGAMLRDVEKLCEFHTGMSTRIGVPIEHLAHGYQEKVASPIYATAIGLLLNGIAFQEEQLRLHPVVEEKIVVQAEPELVLETTTVSKPVVEEQRPQQGGKWLEGIFKKTKEWFEAEPDVDLK
jgi:cell division protein FtsA